MGAGAADAAVVNELARVERIVSRVRVGSFVDLESKIYPLIKHELDTAGVLYTPEFKLGPRCRIDFLTTTKIGIEVKKGKPNSREVTVQLEKYAASDHVAAIILIVERSVWNAPTVVNDKPVSYVALHRLRGIAL